MLPDLAGRCLSRFCQFSDWGMSELFCNTLQVMLFLEDIVEHEIEEETVGTSIQPGKAHEGEMRFPPISCPDLSSDAMMSPLSCSNFICDSYIL